MVPNRLWGTIGGNREFIHDVTSVNVDTCDVRIQLFWESTNSTLLSIVLESIWMGPGNTTESKYYTLEN